MDEVVGVLVEVLVDEDVVVVVEPLPPPFLQPRGEISIAPRNKILTTNESFFCIMDKPVNSPILSARLIFFKCGWMLHFRTEQLLMFSCKARGFSPSCHANRLEEWGTMKVVPFITDHAAVDRFIEHLSLRFVAEKPPPSHVFELVALMAAEERAEYF